MLILVLVLVLKDSLRTNVQSLSLSLSLRVKSLSLSLSLWLIPDDWPTVGNLSVFKVQQWHLNCSSVWLHFTVVVTLPVLWTVRLIFKWWAYSLTFSSKILHRFKYCGIFAACRISPCKSLQDRWFKSLSLSLSLLVWSLSLSLSLEAWSLSLSLSLWVKSLLTSLQLGNLHQKKYSCPLHKLLHV